MTRTGHNLTCWGSSVQRMDIRIELVSVPVTDIDRAIAFYTEQVGFNLDHDHRVSEEVRFVQLTPPGSACSILVGHLSEMQPGTQRGLQCVVPDADAALAQLRERGVDATGVDDQPWGRFVYFSDPDGNTWTYQQLVPPA
jgi:predicted enzyme related to lactoylglutathione lyase